MTIEEKLRHFEKAAINQAKAEGEAMLDEYKASLLKILEEHKHTKERQAALTLETESIRLKREANRALSRQQTELKRRLVKNQEALKDKLFAEVKSRLEEYMDTPAYQELLISQIREILAYAGESPVTIYIDPDDASRQSSLSAALNVPLRIASTSFMGGTRAVLKEKNILIDNSFATKLAEEKTAFTFRGGELHG